LITVLFFLFESAIWEAYGDMQSGPSWSN